MSEKPENSKSGIEPERADESSEEAQPGGLQQVLDTIATDSGSAALTVKKKKNRIQLFPQSIRDGLDVLINAGRGGSACLTHIKNNYHGPLPLPALATCVEYVKMRREDLGSDEGRLQIQRILSKKMDFTSIPKGDKRAMLQAVIEFMAWRIEEVKLLMEHTKSPQFERIITDDTRVIMEAIAEQTSLEKQYGINTERVQAILVVLFRHVGTRVQQAYSEIHGSNRIQEFGERLARIMDELPLETIEQEAIQAFENPGAGGEIL